MASQFITAFLVIGLVVFLGVSMTLGVINSRAKRAAVSDKPYDSANGNKLPE